DDASLIMILLDRRGYDAGHTDAVAAHLHRTGLPFGIEHGRVHRAAVLVAELEDLPDLDAARDRELAAAARARVAGDRVAQIRDFGELRVAFPADAAIVIVRTVRAADEVRERHGVLVDVGRNLEPDRADEAGDRAERFDFGRAQHRERRRDAGKLLRLDRVQLVIAAQKQRDGRGLGAADE